MPKETRAVVVAIALACVFVVCTHAQEVTSTEPDRMSEVDENDLILLNVAAKGRVVELLANELARTEIIRALLVEYARECVENVTALEKQCISCMMDRCENRMSECEIDAPSLSEMMNHNPSPIQGVQFLSLGPGETDEGMREFALKARTDILQGVPETLRQESEEIMRSEVEQSLKDLGENINTEKALKTISLHVQKAADNIHELPDLGDKVSTIIIQNEDRAISLAQLLGRKLKDSRPFLTSIGHNGARILEQVPSVVVKVTDQVDDFKTKVSGVFGRVMDTFKQVMDKPDTPVVNGNGMNPTGPGIPGNPNFQPQMNQFQQQQQFNMGPPPHGRPDFHGNGMAHGGQNDFQKDMIRQQQILNNQLRRDQQLLQQQHMQQQQQFPPPQGGPFPAHPARHVPMSQIDGAMAGQQFAPAPLQGQPLPLQGIPMQPRGPQFQPPIPMQGHPNPVVAAGPTVMSNVIPRSPSVQPSLNPQQTPGGQVQPVGSGSGPNAIPIVQVQSGATGQRFAGGRKRRHVDPDCARLNADPDTYCRTYESQCHNCTLEKRLRFEVCGDGVERARDEIKRLDESVTGYLKSYKDYIAPGPLILKIELNDKNRLHKTNSYYDAFVTAKIGPSIFRYKTKMILNVANIPATGSQIGDELWEKLWETEVFAEAKHVPLTSETVHVMGQAKNKDVHIAHAHTESSAVSHFVSAITVMSTVLIYFL